MRGGGETNRLPRVVFDATKKSYELFARHVLPKFNGANGGRSHGPSADGPSSDAPSTSDAPTGR